MSFLKTTKTFRTSMRSCEICSVNFRERVVGVFEDDGEWLEEYGLCGEQECLAKLRELTIGEGDESNDDPNQT